MADEDPPNENRDRKAAAYAADEAIAADNYRPNIPDGARCYICFDGTGHEAAGDLMRDCSCRGPDAGFLHVRCLVAIGVEYAW